MIPARQAYGRNAIGTALLDAKDRIDANSFNGWRKVIDFSGDSANTFNGPPSPARGKKSSPPASPSMACRSSAVSAPLRRVIPISMRSMQSGSLAASAPLSSPQRARQIWPMPSAAS